MIYTSDERFFDIMRQHVSEMAPCLLNGNIIDCIVAVACLESDYGQSSLAKSQNNFFGMKSPKKRLTLNLDPSKVFATYTDIRSCVFDWFLWFVYNDGHKQNLFWSDDFFDWLVSCGYCPEPDYKTRLRSVFNRINSAFLK